MELKQYEKSQKVYHGSQENGKRASRKKKEEAVDCMRSCFASMTTIKSWFYSFIPTADGGFFGTSFCNTRCRIMACGLWAEDETLRGSYRFLKSGIVFGLA
jgi:hypothetical protein